MSETNEVEQLPRSQATLRYARLTPMKARRVVNLIRGRSAADAASERIRPACGRPSTR